MCSFYKSMFDGDNLLVPISEGPNYISRYLASKSDLSVPVNEVRTPACSPVNAVEGLTWVGE